MSQRTNKKFKANVVDYTVSFPTHNELTPLIDALPRASSLFQRIVDDMIRDASDHDMIRLVFNTPKLDKPVSLPFVRKDQLSHDVFMQKLEATLQSHEEITLDETVAFNVIHMEMPVGGKRNRRKCSDYDELLKTMRCVLRINNNTDNDRMCCARAIVTMIAKIENHPQKRSIQRGTRLQRQMARQLHEAAGIPIEQLCGIPEIKRFEQTPMMTNYRVVVVSRRACNYITYIGPEDRDHTIYLLQTDDHYDLITSMKAFLNKSYYCEKCMKGYDHRRDHSCQRICKLCYGSTCPAVSRADEYVECHKCNRRFKNATCLKNHVENKVCETMYRCVTCDRNVSVELLKKHKREHDCSKKFCKHCQGFFPFNHQCYVSPEPLEKNKQKSYIFFDFECTQESGIHVPNYCVAQITCFECRDQAIDTPCTHCGEKRQFIFKGPTTGDDFCKWLIDEHSDVIAVAHNMKGYDGMFVLDYLYRNCIIPKMILNGAKIMSIDISLNDIKIIDSLNFLPMPLANMPKTFGIEELQKGYFPHFFNTTKNQAYTGPLPDVKYYGPDSMSCAKRQEFLKWYESEKSKNKEFIMAEQLHAYCVSDVDILRKCCMRFQDLFFQATNGVIPFEKSITISSACHYVYRRNFLNENTIAVLPPKGYNLRYKHSKVSIEWLTYMSEKENAYIRHARNEGEVTVGRYRVDGFCESNKTIYEFYGCKYHGCPKCYQFDTPSPDYEDRIMGELFLDTLAREAYIVQIMKEYQVVTMWECDWQRMKDENQVPPHIKTLPGIDDYVPLDPREAFTGGRTNATCLLYDCNEHEKIKYVDFTSLYPWVNKYGIYPLGHPEVITSNFKPVSNYFGLIRCKILPPTDLFHPVLPSKINGKLMFPLCRTCAGDYNQQTCQHSDEERMLHGTWVSIELNEAIRKGYEVSSIESVWHFPRRTQYQKCAEEEEEEVEEEEEEREVWVGKPRHESKTGLFRYYVDQFLKIKQESSGWPDWCQSEADRDKYIADYLRHEGIALDKENIKRNEGMRALAKLQLCSFWGRWGMRNNLTKIEITQDPAVLYEFLTADDKQILDLNFVSDELVEIRWQVAEEFEELSKQSNVVIAAFTTAQARLKLFHILDRLGDRVLYYDTDSIIYVERGHIPDEWSPPLGDYLGDLTDELDGRYIVTFVAGGPKSYAYQLNDGSTVCKIRGITLNYKNSQVLNYNVLNRMVKKLNTKETYKVTVTDNHHITRDIKRQRILSKPLSKDYRIVYDKRVIQDNLFTVPYGWVPHE